MSTVSTYYSPLEVLYDVLLASHSLHVNLPLWGNVVLHGASQCWSGYPGHHLACLWACLWCPKVKTTITWCSYTWSYILLASWLQGTLAELNLLFLVSLHFFLIDKHWSSTNVSLSARLQILLKHLLKVYDVLVAQGIELELPSGILQIVLFHAGAVYRGLVPPRLVTLLHVS